MTPDPPGPSEWRPVQARIEGRRIEDAAFVLPSALHLKAPRPMSARSTFRSGDITTGTLSR
jgi:hypothetical protein